MALAAVLALASVTYVTMEKRGDVEAGDDQPATSGYATVAPTFAKHCVACHSRHPTNAAFAVPPLGVMLDSYDGARAMAPRIKAVAVDSQVMPLGNPTGMTLPERRALGAWIAKGSPR